MNPSKTQNKVIETFISPSKRKNLSKVKKLTSKSKIEKQSAFLKRHLYGHKWYIDKEKWHESMVIYQKELIYIDDG